MGTTPDRRPGPLIEDEEIRLSPNAAAPSQAGAFNYNGGSFQFRDAAGAFDPRSGGGGITEAQHELLDTLTHEIAETSWEEYTYSSGRVVSVVVWASAAKLLKVREEQYTYSGGFVSQVVITQYDGTGAVKATVTEIYTYSAGRVASITRTRT